jgi:hypothetical protein
VANTIGKSIVLRFFWYPTFVYSTCVFGDTATLLCYEFLWSMVVDVKLFTIEKSYHFNRLFCSRPKLVIRYLLKPLLIDRAHSNDSNSGLRPTYYHFRKEAEPLPPLCPSFHFSEPTIHDGDDEARSNYSCHPLNNASIPRITERA